jgi:hypothetical protein
MKIYLALTVLLAMTSCSKNEVTDDTMNTCTFDCTTLSGKITTADGKPAKGVIMTLQSEYHYSSILSRYDKIRKVATAKTDINGNYTLSFGMTPDEVNGTWRFHLYPKYDESIYYPDARLQFGILISDINKGSDNQANYYLAQKQTLKVALKGFQPVRPTDYFYASTSIKVFSFTTLSTLYVEKDQAEKALWVQGNDTTILSVHRMKDSVYTRFDTAVYTPAGVPPSTVTFTY